MSEPSKDIGGAAKIDARDSRLTLLRKANEEVLRKQFQKIAQEKCKPIMMEFGDCVKESGLMVIYNCSQLKRSMNNCVDQHYSEEKFLEYLKEQGYPMPQKRKSIW